MDMPANPVWQQRLFLGHGLCFSLPCCALRRPLLRLSLQTRSQLSYLLLGLLFDKACFSSLVAGLFLLPNALTLQLLVQSVQLGMLGLPHVVLCALLIQAGL